MRRRAAICRLLTPPAKEGFDLGRVLTDGRRSSVRPAFLAGLSDSGTDSIAQDIAFELSKHTASMPASARPLGVVMSSASVRETNPTPTAWSLLERSDQVE